VGVHGIGQKYNNQHVEYNIPPANYVFNLRNLTESTYSIMKFCYFVQPDMPLAASLIDIAALSIDPYHVPGDFNPMITKT
jgi:hypothetical protein